MKRLITLKGLSVILVMSFVVLATVPALYAQAGCSKDMGMCESRDQGCYMNDDEGFDRENDRSDCDPFRHGFRMNDFMNRFFDEPFGGRGGYGPYRFKFGRSDIFSPDIDIRKDVDKYIVDLDLPGMEKDNIDLMVDDGVLTISGKRERVIESKNESEAGDVTYYRQERSFGAFERSIALPENINEEKIEAEYTNGVLSIAIPIVEKTEEETGIKIEVR